MIAMRLSHYLQRNLYKRSVYPTVRGTAELSFSPRPFFKKAGKFFAEAFFQKGRKVFR
ncbi:hypothetical protein AALA99_09555 [Anaerotruncus colihominis]|nr:hypothetical protein [Anaerotruncus colihominis]